MKFFFSHTPWSGNAQIQLSISCPGSIYRLAPEGPSGRGIFKYRVVRRVGNEGKTTMLLFDRPHMHALSACPLGVSQGVHHQARSSRARPDSALSSPISENPYLALITKTNSNARASSQRGMVQ
ncbi:hypothetical protein VTO42DRAFT_5267 [Malbranchea cinnamomea]